MNKIKNIIITCIFIVLLVGCNDENIKDHNCDSHKSDWIYEESDDCSKELTKTKICTICEKLLEVEQYTLEHSYKEDIIQVVTCEQDGIVEKTCIKCNHKEYDIDYTTGHSLKETVLKEANCTENCITEVTCNNCDYKKTIVTDKLGHDYLEECISELTCTQDEVIRYICQRCDHIDKKTTYATGHITGDAKVLVEPDEYHFGLREFYCTTCNELLLKQSYVNNGYYKNGKLSVNGADLVNSKGEKVQLFGLSTHGIQWFGRYANLKTIASIQEEFGNNIIRFAFYTTENGYCDGSKERKEQMLSDLIEGVDAATKLGLYVIIDWHMVGAENVLDKNPLTFLEESKEFFSYISNYYKDQDNILFEIMNEPNGSTTWADCKKYAEEVIPCIRENSDGIILVGNPKWTADLNSVMKNPLKGFTNIMYTYHFYAADHSRTTQVENAYDSGFPVFISEFGFMESSGDGAISTTNGDRWKKVLDERNISYVAWNISNSKGSASIFKYSSSDMYDVSDSNLKEWGIYLKYWYREKSGIDYLI